MFQHVGTNPMIAALKLRWPLARRRDDKMLLPA
jgi:hypothetical protein